MPVGLYLLGTHLRVMLALKGEISGDPLLSDQGTVQKVIVLPQEHGVLEELTLEEVEVFRVSDQKNLDSVPSSCCPTHSHLSLFQVLISLLNLQVPAPVKTLRISSKRVSC